MKRLLLALLILPLFAQAAEYELGKGYHFVKMSGKFYALPPMMAPAQNPSNADQALTRSWATASSAGYAGALAVVSAMGPSPSSNPSNANQVLSDVWNSANNALTIYCVSGCGSQGPTGPTGASGAAGATGATGATGSGGGGTPCTDTALSLQYNNAGSFGCIPSSTYDATTGTLTVGSGVTATTGGDLDLFAHDDAGSMGVNAGGNWNAKIGWGDPIGMFQFLNPFGVPQLTIDLGGDLTTNGNITGIGFTLLGGGLFDVQGTAEIGQPAVATGSIALNGVTSGTATISMADTTNNVTMTGGSASMVVCWKADGVSLGYATVAEISSGTCH